MILVPFLEPQHDIQRRQFNYFQVVFAINSV
jgi:hypothetical protein